MSYWRMHFLGAAGGKIARFRTCISGALDIPKQPRRNQRLGNHIFRHIFCAALLELHQRIAHAQLVDAFANKDNTR
ncbi:hypothetical protein FNL37_1977 [Methylovorus glucosotrophus]|nr:hypothetical protein FNL37_1977 [Methylovorus glucosotrophus]